MIEKTIRDAPRGLSAKGKASILRSLERARCEECHQPVAVDEMYDGRLGRGYFWHQGCVEAGVIGLRLRKLQQRTASRTPAIRQRQALRDQIDAARRR